MRSIIFCVFASILYCSVYGQTPGIQWQMFDVNRPSGFVYPTADSGVLVLSNDIFKVDKKGVLQWSLVNQPAINDWGQIIPSSDGAFFALAAGANSDTSETLDLSVTKFTSSGKLLWQKFFGGSKDEHYYSAVATGDGGCVVVGETASDDGDVAPANYAATDSFSTDCWIIRIDAAGNQIWQKRMGSTTSDHAVRVVGNGAGGFIVGCYVGQNDGDFAGADPYARSLWLLALDGSGKELWKKQYGASNWFRDIRQTADGGFLVLADGYSGPNNHGYTDVWMAKVDGDGNVIWEKNYGGSEAESCDYHATIETDNAGNYYVAAVSYSTDGDVTSNHGGQDVWVFKINEAGTLLWQKTFGGAEDDHAFLRVQSNGDVLLCFNTNSADGIFTGGYGSSLNLLDRDIWVFKLNSQGEEQWRRLYGGNGDDFATLEFYYDNVYYLNGYSQSFKRPGTEGEDFLWLTKIGPANLIKATAFLDNNKNGIKEPDEKFSTDVSFTAQKDGIVTALQGPSRNTFVMDVDSGSYTVNLVSTPAYYTSASTAQNIRFSTYFNTDSISFALQPIAGKQDLRIELFPVTVARPGFTAAYRLLYQNVGTTTFPSMEIRLAMDHRTTLQYALPSPSGVVRDTLQWRYSTISPGDTGSIWVYVKLAAPPGSTIGDTLSYLATIGPLAGDETPSNDSAVLRQLIIGSFDPNDKSENNAGLVPPSFITSGNYLQYTVRFQNTGTDTAFNVVVRDTLSSRVDASTLQVLASSHPFRLQIDNGNQLTWSFTNIDLPDSTVNEPSSHGYIVYRVRPQKDVIAGETIHNTASIYFDYNLPVVTNDAKTKVQATLVALPQGLLHFYGNEQNAQIQLFWQIATNTGIRLFEVERSLDGRTFHVMGTRLAAGSSLDYSFADNVKGLTASTVYYRLKLIEPNGGYQYSKVLLFQNDQGNTSVLRIYPNPVVNLSFVVVHSGSAGKAELQLLSATGALIAREQVTVQTGKNVFPLSKTTAITPGLYTLRMVKGQEVKTSTLIIE